MPKATFYNLQEEKRKRVMAAALREFSQRPFREASINRIVKAAGISRGSFYQYFADKEDIYMYMITEIGKEKLELFQRAEVLAGEEDFFSALMGLYDLALDWISQKPEYGQIAMLMELDDSGFTGRLRELSREGLALVKEMLERDQRRGLIRADIDTDLVVDLLYHFFLYAFKQYYREGSGEDLRQKLQDILTIIKEGIANFGKAADGTREG